MVHVGSQLTAIHDLDQARLRPVELIESMTPPSTTSYNMTWSLIQSPLDNSMIVSICIEELNARATFDVALLAVVWSRQEAPRTKLFGARGVTEEDIYATIAHALQRLVAMSRSLVGWVTRCSPTSVAAPQATPANLFAGVVWIGGKLVVWGGAFAHTLCMISKLFHVF
jgi:hypothetical protein